jgi:hypothetical protein
LIDVQIDEAYCDREICVSSVQRRQMNVTRALAPSKEQHKRKQQMNVTRALTRTTYLCKLAFTEPSEKSGVDAAQQT